MNKQRMQVRFIKEHPKVHLNWKDRGIGWEKSGNVDFLGMPGIPVNLMANPSELVSLQRHLPIDTGSSTTRYI